MSKSFCRFFNTCYPSFLQDFSFLTDSCVILFQAFSSRKIPLTSQGTYCPFLSSYNLFPRVFTFLLFVYVNFFWYFYDFIQMVSIPFVKHFLFLLFGIFLHCFLAEFFILFFRYCRYFLSILSITFFRYFRLLSSRNFQTSKYFPFFSYSDFRSFLQVFFNYFFKLSSISAIW